MQFDVLLSSLLHKSKYSKEINYHGILEDPAREDSSSPKRFAIINYILFKVLHQSWKDL